MDETLAKALDYLWIAAVAIIGFVFKPLFSDVRSLKDGQKDCDIKLQEFKTHVSENYSKESSTQASLSRIHERMDDISQSMESKIGEVARDVKQLLTRVK